MRMLVALILLAGAGAMAQSTTTQATEARNLAELLEPIRHKHKLPALAGAIVQKGELTAIGVSGRRRLDRDTPATLDDRFHLGSNGKAMTATAIARLVEAGKLKWTTTIGDVFPERHDAMHADFRGVTIEMLLAHRSGAPADLDADGLWMRLVARKGTPTEQRLELLDGVVTKPPAYPPGTQALYTNAGYAIAGAMAERVTGTAWESLIQELVFSPLGITTAGFGAPGDAAALDQPWGHQAGWFSATPVPPGPRGDNPPAIAPAGTMHMTLRDYAKFIALHLTNGRSMPGYLKPETFEKLHTVVGDDLALGWIVAQRPWGGTVLTHAGSNTFWYVIVWLAPEKDFAVIAATNQGGSAAQQACDDASVALLRSIMRE